MKPHHLAISLTAVATAFPIVAHGAEPEPVPLRTEALIDSIAPERRGDVIQARSDSHAIGSFKVTFTSGVTGRVPEWRRDVKAVAYVLLSGDQGQIRTTGFLVVHAGDKRPRNVVTLTANSLAGLSGRFTPGTRPRLRLTGIPAGTHSVELTTVGVARDMLRRTGRCVRHLKADTNTFTVNLDGATRRQRHRAGIFCGPLPKAS